eukprot:366318-Chlamydomonas_euryale.AAC.2
MSSPWRSSRRTSPSNEACAGLSGTGRALGLIRLGVGVRTRRSLRSGTVSPSTSRAIGSAPAPSSSSRRAMPSGIQQLRTSTVIMGVSPRRSCTPGSAPNARRCSMTASELPRRHPAARCSAVSPAALRAFTPSFGRSGQPKRNSGGSAGASRSSSGRASQRRPGSSCHCGSSGVSGADGCLGGSAGGGSSAAIPSAGLSVRTMRPSAKSRANHCPHGNTTTGASTSDTLCTVTRSKCQRESVPFSSMPMMRRSSSPRLGRSRLNMSDRPCSKRPVS